MRIFQGHVEQALEVFVAVLTHFAARGVFRTEELMGAAVDKLVALRQQYAQVQVDDKGRRFNTDLLEAWELGCLLEIAEVTAISARARTESRGAHYRRDFPQRDDRDWLVRTLATWPGPEASLPELGYESLALADMELAPGWRGYGEKNHIDHPDTAARTAEIERVRESMAGHDRFAVQDALLPYRELLPERYRGRNARLGENGGG